MIPGEPFVRPPQRRLRLPGRPPAPNPVTVTAQRLTAALVVIGWVVWVFTS